MGVGSKNFCSTNERTMFSETWRSDQAFLPFSRRLLVMNRQQNDRLSYRWHPSRTPFRPSLRCSHCSFEVSMSHGSDSSVRSSSSTSSSSLVSLLEQRHGMQSIIPARRRVTFHRCFDFWFGLLSIELSFLALLLRLLTRWSIVVVVALDTMGSIDRFSSKKSDSRT